MIYVCGHKSPDTDAVCSAIVCAWYLGELGVQDATPVLASSLENKEALYVLDRFGFGVPEVVDGFMSGDKVAIVDTNNLEELPTGINQAVITGIVDHHKLTGGISTESPIPVRIEPVASTCGVLWKLIDEAQLQPTKEIAGLMVAAMVSDTLKMTSPTTTGFDRQAIEALAKIAEVDIDSLAEEMFVAKSDLTGFSGEDVLLLDSKIFEMGENKVRISVLETTNPSTALGMRMELEKAMVALKQKENLNYLLLFVVDILNSSAALLAVDDTDKEMAEKAFKGTFKNGVMELPGVVSRKKQMVPQVEAVLK